MTQSVISWLSCLPWCLEIPSKSYCLVCRCLQNPIKVLLCYLTWYTESHTILLSCLYSVRNPIKILLSCLPLCVKSHPKPTVSSNMIYKIPYKSFCLAWHDIKHIIQILVTCLTWFKESHINPTVLPAMIRRIQSKSKCIVWVNQIAKTSFCVSILYSLLTTAFRSRILVWSSGAQ